MDRRKRAQVARITHEFRDLCAGFATNRRRVNLLNEINVDSYNIININNNYNNTPNILQPGMPWEYESSLRACVFRYESACAWSAACVHVAEEERERKDRSGTISCGPRVRNTIERESEKTLKTREEERERGREKERERERVRKRKGTRVRDWSHVCD